MEQDKKTRFDKFKENAEAIRKKPATKEQIDRINELSREVDAEDESDQSDLPQRRIAQEPHYPA